MDIEDAFREGERQYENKNFELAATLYSKIIDTDGKHVNAIEQRSMCYLHMGKLEESLRDMNRVRDLEPNNPYRYASRAYLKSIMKDLDGAIEDYRRAVHLDPKDAIAHNNLGLLLEQKGYQKQAAESWRIADDLAKRNQKKNSSVPSQKLELSESDLNSTSGTASFTREIKNVFTTKKGFTEFTRFVLNGFKLKE